MNRVLALVVTFNAMPWLDRCIGSLEKSTVGVDVMVVDNCSTDGTRERIKNSFPKVRLYGASSNLGFGAANNIGFAYALEKGYDWVYMMNQDAWIMPDTLKKMLDAWPLGYGILSPIQKDAQGRLDANFEKHCSSYLGGENPLVSVSFVMAAHWLLSAETIRTVGAFSPAFHHYGEDDNYIHRLDYHGLKLGVLTTAEAVHDRGQRKDSPEKRMRLKCVSTVVGLSDPRRCLFLMAILEPFELIGMSLKNFSMAPLRYLPEFLRNYPKFIRLRRASKHKGAFI